MSWSRAEDPCQKNFSELANNNTILGGARERGVWGSGPLFKIIMLGVIKCFKGRPLLELLRAHMHMESAPRTYVGVLKKMYVVNGT